MRRVLRLRWIQRDLDCFFFLVDVEVFAKGLVVLGIDLDQDCALRNGWNFRQSLLIGLQFPLGSDLPAKLYYRMSFDELDDHAGVLDGFAGLVPHLNGESSHVGAQQWQ